MISIDLENKSVAAGDYLKFNFLAYDEHSGFNSARFYFKNENNNTFSFTENLDGNVSHKLSSGQATGKYFLDYIQLYDSAYSTNDIYYRNTGKTDYYDDQNSFTVYGDHGFDFSKINVEVTDSVAAPDPQTDRTPPTIDGLALLSQDQLMVIDPDLLKPSDADLLPDPLFITNMLETVSAGDFLHVYYDATDTGRGINYANLRMRHEDGSSISAYDYDQDGIITFEIPTSASSGDYIFESFSIYDKATTRIM